MRDENEVAIQNNQLSSHGAQHSHFSLVHHGKALQNPALPQAWVQQEPHYHTFMDYPGQYITGIIVPQKGYTTSGQPGWAPLPSITFEVNGRLGLRLRDALAMPILGLTDRQSLPTLTTTGNALTLRIIVSLDLNFVALANLNFLLTFRQWPGYPGWDHQRALHAFDHTITAQQRTKEYIANRLASLVQEFYNVRL